MQPADSGLVRDPERISTYHLLMGAVSPGAGGAADRARTAVGGARPQEPDRRQPGTGGGGTPGIRLRDALSTLRERYQFIVLDCPPALDLLTLNALVAADAVLIPMQAEYFALEGISELMDTVERIRGSFNPELTIEGVVLTMLDDRTNLAQQVMSELKRYFGDKLCATTIPRNIRLAEAPSHGRPALLYDPRSKGAESYIRLAKEIIAHYLPAEEPKRRRRRWTRRLSRSMLVYVYRSMTVDVDMRDLKSGRTSRAWARPDSRGRLSSREALVAQARRRSDEGT